MTNRQKATAIWNDIAADLKNGARLNTRDLTARYSQKYNTPKQRVCGVLSAMKRCGTIKIFSSRPNSIAYF